MTRFALASLIAPCARCVQDPFMDIDYMIYQLQYDSVHGRFKGTIEKVVALAALMPPPQAQQQASSSTNK